VNERRHAEIALSGRHVLKGTAKFVICKPHRFELKGIARVDQSVGGGIPPDLLADLFVQRGLFSRVGAAHEQGSFVVGLSFFRGVWIRVL